MLTSFFNILRNASIPGTKVMNRLMAEVDGGVFASCSRTPRLCVFDNLVRIPLPPDMVDTRGGWDIG